MAWRKNKPEYIIVHHTAVSYKRNPDQYEATKRYHISKGWGDIGYHFEISKRGKLYKGREISTPGAHTKQDNMNYRSIGIVLDGNFDIELPTREQKETLRKLLKKLSKTYSIPITNILPHRHWARYKTCYGSKLSNDWAANLLYEDYDKDFIDKWEGKIIIDVEDKGKAYYVFNGLRFYIPPKLAKHLVDKGLVTGFKHKDVLRIPSGD